ncbi:2'-5' RNA ligase family protein [Streptomyces tendae]|uniref:2'-5' RNA ligase family protein n=1 Tax=Streptomyces tendae TaxID=1932 RepID=UPI00167A77AF|nr:2'-5' RNA ligase family protein [Streptomyces tendae]
MQKVLRVEDFFTRVGRVWPAGRRDLHWHLLPTEAEARALTVPYAEVVSRPGLQPVPPQWMHCTLLHAVGAGRSAVDTDGLVDTVRQYAQTVTPFTLTFDRPAVGPVAVEISGWPGQPFAELGTAVTEAMTGSGVPFTAARSRYPHMSVAYTTEGAEDVDAIAVKASLADVAGPLSATVYVDRLHLVEQWHDGAHITWEPLAEVHLAGAGAPA